jgi:hypothetical protein
MTIAEASIRAMPERAIRSGFITWLSLQRGGFLHPFARSGIGCPSRPPAFARLAAGQR